VLRLVAGIIFIAHGAQKLFGIWGGGGPSGTAAFFDQLGLTPAYPLAVGVGLLEFIGGLCLVAGAFTLVTAILLSGNMVVAVWKVHLASGFFLNWTLVQGQGHGYEYNLALIGALVSLMLTGPGTLSVDERRSRAAEYAAASRVRAMSSRL
jgi:putative oxidoreductase